MLGNARPKHRQVDLKRLGDVDQEEDAESRVDEHQQPRSDEGAGLSGDLDVADPPCQQSESSEDRQRPEEILDEVAVARHDHRVGLLDADERDPLRGVPNQEVVHEAIDEGNDAVDKQRPPPTVGDPEGVLEETERDPGEGDGSPCRPEVAPSGIEPLGPADHLRREPLSNHADPDHEAGSDRTQHEP